MVKNIYIYISIMLIFLGPLLDSRIKLSLILSLLITILVILRNKKIVIDEVFFVILIYLMLNTGINIIFKNTNITLFLKQVLGISISYLLYKNVLYKFNVEKSIGVYLKIAFIICIIGLVQQLAFLFKINPIYDLSWLIDKQRIGITNLGLIRITSLMIEPAQLAMVITPAVYISFNSIYRKQYKLISKRKTFLFIICYLITFSSVAYLGFAIIFLLNIKNSKNALKKIIAFSLLFICITSLYNFVDDFKMRVDDTILAVTRGNIESKNLSTFALISNLKVSLKSIEATYGFGSGIGSHEINYYKYIDAVIDQSKVQMELNVEDANSMLLRLLSELGIFGALAVLMFIIKFNLKIKNNSINKVINDAIISLFILRLLRQGHYFNDGFFFFVILYIKNNKEYYNIKSNNL